MPSKAARMRVAPGFAILGKAHFLAIAIAIAISISISISISIAWAMARIGNAAGPVQRCWPRKR